MMQIRKATLSDFESIQKLSKDHYLYEKKYSKVFNEEWPYLTSGKEYYAKRLVSDNSIFLVSEEKNNIIGFLLGFIDTYNARKDNPNAEIEQLFIVENYRNKGVGTKLIKEFKKVAKTKKVKRLRVTCFLNNYEAINFYKKYGFNDFGIILEQDL